MQDLRKKIAHSLQLIQSQALYQMCLVFSHRLLVKGADYAKFFEK